MGNESSQFVLSQKTAPARHLTRLLLVNLEKMGFSQKLVFHYFKWNSGGLGVSRRTAPTIRCYLQSFSRFGGTWGQKVHFWTFDGKLTFQCTRNGPRNLQFCPGSLQDTFIIYSSISHQYISNIFCKKENRNKHVQKGYWTRFRKHHFQLESARFDNFEHVGLLSC